jgi:hypothetical protein
VMGPVDDLPAVAVAGRKIGQTYRTLLMDDAAPPFGAEPYLTIQLARHLRHGESWTTSGRATALLGSRICGSGGTFRM